MKLEYSRSWSYHLAFIPHVFINFFFIVSFFYTKDTADYLPYIIVVLLESSVTYYYAFAPYKIYFFDKETHYKNILGQIKVFSNESVSYQETYHVLENEKEQTSVLKIYFPYYRVYIYKNKTSQYEEFKSFCKEKYKYAYHVQSEYKYYLPLIVSCFLFFGFWVYKRVEEAKIVTGYVKVKGTYSDYRHPRRSKGGVNKDIVMIVLEEYPEVYFVPRLYNKNRKKEYEEKIFIKGKTSTYIIKRNDFEKKLEKSKEMTFYDKYEGRNAVDVEQIEELK